MTVFDEVVGQAAAVAVLHAAADAAATGSPGMTHAWLLTGPPGSGRSVAARAFAAALQCPRGGCGDCHDCRTVAAGTHVDVLQVVPQGLSISVDEVRALVVRATQAPVATWRVILVEDADRLSERAADALLKAIEEPSPRTVWLLCAPSEEDVPPTVRSRCRRVRLVEPGPAAIADLLVRRDGVDPALAAFAARASAGHVGRARRLATDEQARLRRRDVLAMTEALVSVSGCLTAAENLVDAAREEGADLTRERDETEVADLSQALGASGPGGGGRIPRGGGAALKDLTARQKSRSTRVQRDALDRALTDLAAFYRDVLVRQVGARSAPVHVDLVDRVAAEAAATTPEASVRRVRAVLACRAAIDANVAPLLAVEAMALQMMAAGRDGSRQLGAAAQR